MKIAIDFDNTIVNKLNIPFKNSIDVLRRLSEKHDLILYTSRYEARRKEALKFLRDNGVKISEPDFLATVSRKFLADLYIDDKNLGGLPSDENGDPDWIKIEKMIG